MLDKGQITKGLIAISAVLLLSYPGQAQAADWGKSRHSKYDRDDRHYGRHHGRHHDHHPKYQHSHKSYPPHGKAVIRLPGGSVKIIIGRKGYYYCDGVYYRRNINRYVVVAPPVESSFTVEVPGSRGRDVSITLRKSGDGYVGPRGEFYPVFPTTDELRFRYNS